MSYNQYTQCELPQNHSSMDHVVSVIIQGLVAGAIAAAIVAGWCSLFALPVMGFVSSIAFCQWWLYHRLICLGGDVSAVGMLVSVEPPSEKHDAFGELDSDFSINLLLWPNEPGATQAQVEGTAPYGYLVTEQAATHDIGLPFSGSEPEAEPKTTRKSWVFHAEFEGAGIVDFMTGSQIALGFAVAALIACAAIPPPWGFVVAAILAFLAFLAWLIGYIVGASDWAAPSDVSGTPSELHTNDPTTHLGAYLLYVQGTWVFDSAHTGWNEIHPIKVCTKIGEWGGAWPPDVPEIVKGLDAGFAEAADPQTKDRQRQDHNDWTMHPDVDGCGDDDAPEPPR